MTIALWISLVMAGADLVPVATEVDRLLSDHRDGGVLSRDASEDLVRVASLDWPIERWLGGGMGALGVVAPNAEHAVLVGSKWGEWGPYRETAYALIRRTGEIAWSDSGYVCLLPLVNDAAQDKGRVSIDTYRRSVQIPLLPPDPVSWFPDALVQVQLC